MQPTELQEMICEQRQMAEVDEQAQRKLLLVGSVYDSVGR